MRVRSALLFFLVLGFSAVAEVPDPEALPDLTIPAVIRADGLHGPIRTDVSILNRSPNIRRVLLQLLSRTGGRSNIVPVDIPAFSRSYVRDVVAYVYPGQDDVREEGVLLVRGYVPEGPGDIAAETYYDNGHDGRIGTVLPVFVEGGPAKPLRVLLSSTLAGDPRLNLFAIRPADQAAEIPVYLMISVSLPGLIPSVDNYSFSANRYVSQRLSELLPHVPEDALVTISTGDQAVHAMLTRSDPATGCPFIVASP